MPPRETIELLREALPTTILCAAPCVVLLYLIDAGRIPRFGLTHRAGPQEPPLWSWTEVVVIVLSFLAAQVFFGSTLVGLKESGVLGEAGLYFITTIVSSLFTAWVVHWLVVARLGQSLETLGLVECPVSNVPTVLGLYFITFFPLAAVTILWQLALFGGTGSAPESQAVVQLFEKSVREHDTLSLAILVVLGVLVAPITEELLFRGLILGWLRVRWGTWMGAAISSVLFAAVHGSLGALVPLLALGMLLAYIAIRTGSIYCAMLYHAVFNGVSFLVLFTRSGNS